MKKPITTKDTEINETICALAIAIKDLAKMVGDLFDRVEELEKPKVKRKVNKKEKE